MIFTHGGNSVSGIGRTLPSDLVAIVSGTKYYGFDSITFGDNTTELVRDLLDKPVYANVGTSLTHRIISRDSNIIKLLEGTSDFTIECYIKLRAVGTTGGSGSPIFGLNPTSNYGTWNLTVALTSTGALTCWINDSWIISSQITGLSYYKHLALTRKNSTYTLYYDGVSRGYGNGTVTPGNAEFVMPFCYDNRSDYNVVQLCIWNNCKYLSNFTPPTTVYDF